MFVNVFLNKIRSGLRDRNFEVSKLIGLRVIFPVNYKNMISQ